MNIPISACLISGCLLVGGLSGAVEKIGNEIYYDGFINDPANFHLVDDLGRPVSQEPK